MSGNTGSSPTVSGGSGSSPTTSGGSSSSSTPTTALCVVQAFGSYTVGQVITDADTVAEVKAAAAPGFVASIAWPMPGNTPPTS